MSGYKILLLLSAISFLIGALLPVLVVPAGTPRQINWLCLGLAFAAFAVFIGAH